MWLISLHFPHIAAQVLCLPSSSITVAVSLALDSQLMYAGCYLSLPQCCISFSDWHVWQILSPINTWRHLDYHWTCNGFHTVCSELSSRQQKDDFFADFVKKGLINIIFAEWKVQRSPDFFPTQKRCDGYKMLERHCRTQCWPTPLITHAVKATMLSLTPSFHQGWVYQHCPEQSTPMGSHLRRCPSVRSCRGLSPHHVTFASGPSENHRLAVHWVRATGHFGARRLFHDTVTKTSVCCANPQGS